MFKITGMSCTCASGKLPTIVSTIVILMCYGLVGIEGKTPGFGYYGAIGPTHWVESYDTCVGKHQSPINIEEHIVTDVFLSPLQFSGENVTQDFELENNGHTAMLKPANGTRPVYVSGGPLPFDENYRFEQLHFHWGENDLEGSEDLINNHSFAMELHAVFYKDSYGSFKEAIGHSDGLAVLAFFFEVDKDDPNEQFEDIVKNLPQIEKPDTKVTLPTPVELGKFLIPEDPPEDRLENYFTYAGSLTTPPCTEVVTWIDFKDPLTMSPAQLAAFRDINDSEGGKITHNFRPIQPRENRKILRNAPILTRNNKQIDEPDQSLDDDKPHFDTLNNTMESTESNASEASDVQNDEDSTGAAGSLSQFSLLFTLSGILAAKMLIS